MKKLNYILMALVSVMAFTWTACDDEIEYTPAGSEGLDGVYFATDIASDIVLSKDASSFDVQISRGSDAGSATVYLTVEADSATNAIFTFPDSVTFEEGNTVANISIAYNPEALVYDEQYAFTISVPAEMASPYGNASFNGVAVLPAPWVSLGMATYTDDILLPLFGYSPVTYQVEIQENQENPGMYRLVNPYGENFAKACAAAGIGIPDYSQETIYLTFSIADPNGVVFNKTNSGCDWGYGEMSYACLQYGTYADGIVKFPTKGLVVYDNDGGYYANNNGAFVIAFPGVAIADYSVEVAYAGRFVDPSGEVNTAIANVTLGKDVESAIVGMALSNDPNAVLSGMMDGSIEVKEITESGKVELALAEDGVYTIVAVSVAGGEMQEAAYASFEFTTGGSEWESLGMGTMTDGVVGPVYGASATTYAVEIQHSTKTPGMYRVVNPYGETFPYNAAGSYDSSKNYYLEINAQDPEAVYFGYTPTGLTLNSGDGMISVYSLAGYYLDNGITIDQLKSVGYCGTLADNQIVFSPGNVLVTFENDNNLYQPKKAADFVITLPTEGVSTASVPVSELKTLGSFNGVKPAANWKLQHEIGASKFRMNK